MNLLNILLLLSLLTKMLKTEPAKFGTVLGITDGGCKVYSCDYKSADKSSLNSQASYESYHDGIYTGFKYQCVELARRYLLINYGVIFDSIPMAYDIFDLKYVTRVKDKAKFKIRSYPNGSKVLPVKGSLLIWNPVGEFKMTGHVAIVVESGSQYIDIVEQNVEDSIWTANYSRRLEAMLDEHGHYHINCTYSDASILGWVNLYLDQEYLERELQCSKDDLNHIVFEIPEHLRTCQFIDPDEPFLNLFIKQHGGGIIEQGGKTGTFFSLTESGHEALISASEELHKMFLRATDMALRRESFLKDYFQIPEFLWPKIRESWAKNRNDIVSARFDFSVNDGIKAYEYNADSASCLLECGYIQDAWAKASGIGHIGRNSSDDLFYLLTKTWRNHNVQGTLHLFCDDDNEEKYHTLYMKSAAEKAGLNCKVIWSIDELSWDSDGNIEDKDHEVIKNIWKTWSWQTILEQLNDPEALKLYNETDKRSLKRKPLLSELFLHDKIRVFEPFWTVIPASKAILPILTRLYNNHTNLLRSYFELTPELEKSGYVVKPVRGRGGGSIALIGDDGKVIHKKDGKWGDDKVVYQELCVLPLINEFYVQVCTWIIGGNYGGAVLRVSESPLVDIESSVYCLRIE